MITRLICYLRGDDTESQQEVTDRVAARYHCDVLYTWLEGDPVLCPAWAAATEAAKRLDAPILVDSIDRVIGLDTEGLRIIDCSAAR